MKTSKTIYPIISLFMVIFIDTMGFGIIFPVLSPMFMGTSGGMLPAGASIAMRDLFYGLTLGAFAICMFFGAPVLGDISDSLGRKKVLLICLFGTAISSFVCGIGIQYGSILLLIIGRVFSGFLAGSQPIAQAAMADLSEGKSKTKLMGIIAFAGAVGFVVGPIFGGYFSDNTVVSWFNYSTPFMVNALLALINGLVLLVSFKETYTGVRTLRINLYKGVEVFLEAFRKKEVRTLSTIFLFSETAFSLYFQFVSLYLVATYHYSPSKLGLFMSYSGVLFAISLAVVMRVALKFTTENKIAFWSLLITAFGFALPILSKNIYVQWLAAIPIIMASGLSYNAFLSIYSNAVSQTEQGWVMGVSSSIMGMSWVLGAALMSILFYFHPVLPFYLAGMLTLAAAILFKGFMRHHALNHGKQITAD